MTGVLEAYVIIIHEAARQIQRFLGISKGPGIFHRMRQEVVYAFPSISVHHHHVSVGFTNTFISCCVTQNFTLELRIGVYMCTEFKGTEMCVNAINLG
jgi:hypothetical protein